MTEREPWLGHRDLCELQWGQPCECDNGPEYLAEAGLSRPKLLDLFAGAQGIGVGYARSGFEVTAVDIETHAKHPEVHEFVTEDALVILDDLDFLSGFDVIHASPPCQGYCTMSAADNEHPRLIAPVREKLQRWGGTYVIENVVGARKHLDHPMRVCGQALGLKVRRHRLFESNAFLFGTPCVHPSVPIGVYGDHPEDSPNLRPNGTSRGLRARSLEEGRQAMGIDWMDWDDLTEAVPPLYAEFIGTQLIDHMATLEASV